MPASVYSIPMPYGSDQETIFFTDLYSPPDSCNYYHRLICIEISCYCIPVSDCSDQETSLFANLYFPVFDL